MVGRERKIAANYIFWPGRPLVKNGYIVVRGDGHVEVKETGGRIWEIEGLEFYGGLIVPGRVCCCAGAFREGEALLPVLERCYAAWEDRDFAPALIEGADLRALAWRTGAVVRLL